MLKNHKKIIAGDLIYSISAIVLMNAVLQFIIYPFLNSRIGEKQFGDLLYILGIIAVFSPSIGLAANNTRLVIRRQFLSANGDYLFFLVSANIIAAIIGTIIIYINFHQVYIILIFILLLTLTNFRYYSDVEYRLNLTYKNYFFYYLILSFGYLLGLIIFNFYKNYFLVFIMGEGAALLFIVLTGTIYQKPFDKSENYKKAVKSCAILSSSYLLYYFTLNIDRLLLLHLIDSGAVTKYYVASLIGKTAALLVGPISTILISYLTRTDKKITKKQWSKMLLFCALLGTVFFIGCIFITPVFIKILYPGLYADIGIIIWGANLAQIICFTTSLLLIVVLTFCNEKWQFYIQLSYAIVFIGLTIPFTIYRNLSGFTIAAVIANIFRLVFTVILGYKKTSLMGET